MTEDWLSDLEEELQEYGVISNTCARCLTREIRRGWGELLHLRRALQAIALQPCQCGTAPYDDGNPCGSCYARRALAPVESRPETDLKEVVSSGEAVLPRLGG